LPETKKPSAGHCRRFSEVFIKKVCVSFETKRPSNDLPAT
jgi:hypothetical protein